MRILIFGDGAWAGRSVLRLCQDGHAVTGVVLRRRPSSDDLQGVAGRVGAVVLQPDDPSSVDFVGQVAALAPELVLSVAYDRILRSPLLGVPARGGVNFHAGKLPEYRGRNVVNWAILNGEREIGLTAHVMDEGIDSGAILLQRTLPIGWTDTYADVLRHVVDAMPDLVADTVAGLAAETLVARPQSPSGGTYYGGRVSGDEWLDWRDTSRDLYNKIRGITRPGPGARTLLGGRPVVIWRAEYDPAWPRYRATPGEVVGRGADGSVTVKTGDSTVVIHEAQVGDEAPGPPRWAVGRRLGVNPAAALAELEGRVAALERRLQPGRES
jgi:methionyl-tRNA formyltransferase